MIDTKLRFTEAVAAQRELAVFNEIVRAQVGNTGAQGRLAQGSERNEYEYCSC